jgi:hypothetical protein
MPEKAAAYCPANRQKKNRFTMVGETVSVKLAD